MKKKIVFILEDDKDIREIVSLVLSGSGYQVEQCGTVLEFQQVMAEKMPDMCLLDISLPDGNGLDVCRQLKENNHTAQIPVLLMSAHLHPSALANEHYHDDFIPKPFNISDLKKKIMQYG